MHEKDFLNFFIKKLEEIGFSRDSIILDYKLKNDSLVGYVDIAIIEPITNNILSIFEIKVQQKNQNQSQLLEIEKKQLLKYINLLNNQNILAYLVVVKNYDDFEIFPFEVDEKGERTFFPSISIENITPYNILSNKNRVDAIEKATSEIKKTTDWFKITCWVCATILAILAFLDGIKYISISNTQLVLFGAIIALVIMPFSRKLKILGVEFERLIDKKDQLEK